MLLFILVLNSQTISFVAHCRKVVSEIREARLVGFPLSFESTHKGETAPKKGFGLMFELSGAQSRVEVAVVSLQAPLAQV